MTQLTTPTWLLPYPDQAETANVPRDLQALAEAADGAITQVHTTGAPVVTVLPTLPVDGYEVYYVVDAVNGIVWHLRYRSASASVNKWEYVGGSALSAELGSQASPGLFDFTAAWLDLSPPGPLLTVPLVGEYEIGFGCRFSQTPGREGLQTQIGVSLDGTANPADDCVLTTGSVTPNGALTEVYRVIRRALPGPSVKLRYRWFTGTETFANRSLTVRPVRVH